MQIAGGVYPVDGIMANRIKSVGNGGKSLCTPHSTHHIPRPELGSTATPPRIWQSRRVSPKIEIRAHVPKKEKPNQDFWALVRERLGVGSQKGALKLRGACEWLLPFCSLFVRN